MRTFATSKSGGVSNHNLLSATHPDTLAASPTRGDIIIANSTPAWSRKAIGGYGQVPWSDGTDLAYKSSAFIGGFVNPTFSTSSTTYVDVTGMTIALPANNIFTFEIYGTFTTSDNAAGATNGIGISINGTGGTSQSAVYTLWWQVIAENTSGNNTSSTVPFNIRNENTFDSMTATANVISVATSLVFIIKGFYYTGSGATSTLALRVLSENAAPQTAKIQVGTGMLLTRQA